MNQKSRNTLVDSEQDMPLSSTLSDDDKSPWYAVRVFFSKQEVIADFFKTKGLEYFIPMEYTDFLDKEKHIRHALRPVVHNLIFVKKTMAEKLMRAIMSEVPYKISVLRKHREHLDYYEIPSRQMFEFRVMCNPDIEMRKYLSEDDAKLKAGTPVRVTFGPLKGLSGKLVRQSKKYYLLKEVPGIAVMIKVSRWCCSAMENNQD